MSDRKLSPEGAELWSWVGGRVADLILIAAGASLGFRLAAVLLIGFKVAVLIGRRYERRQRD